MGDLIVGLDSGTSVIKAVAFDPDGTQIAVASVPNRYESGADGAATQDMERTWQDAAAALRSLAGQVEDLAGRTVGLAVTGQGDGTWLVDAAGQPVGAAWLWLDARAAPTVRRLTASSEERVRFETTGTGLNTCQMGAQLAHIARTEPHRLQAAAHALHCKDWLHLRLTGVAATDPSEASFTFGDFRTRRYDDRVIAALGLEAYRHLLPPILEGTEVTHPLLPEAAAATGLRAGTPVCLGYVDMAMTALGAGVHLPDESDAACSVIGSTGVHLRAVPPEGFHLNAEGTGYAIPIPVPDRVTQVQTNMAATLNLDWLLDLAGDLLAEMGRPVERADLVGRIEGWLAQSTPGQVLYHPYISEAGERGPFVEPRARAGFNGLSRRHRFADLVRAVIEGLGYAMRDCYGVMGPLPAEIRLTGGAVRSPALRAILAAACGARARVCLREEAGAAGAAMMAAVALGLQPSMDACIRAWVTPHLGPPEPPDPDLATLYDRRFAAYLAARRGLAPAWTGLACCSGGPR
ncbi:FGGY-family carbohydrate kinase [Rubellimicrobium sp. CFH 75288]|uniref:FGGY-family carbohydrate kinase n=1 Tax=Rubellimicrobium sp. CFH 75288 TaxID=2697034 RepID=UPI0014121F01|nr:FGGY-family carbohydrate kinase [Rubellimicrobium sp. CFH 75288]NAZ36368.1 carbohydrate kinase [Rubellimicrobium sp. CFH 75288]